MSCTNLGTKEFTSLSTSSLVTPLSSLHGIRSYNLRSNRRVTFYCAERHAESHVKTINSAGHASTPPTVVTQFAPSLGSSLDRSQFTCDNMYSTLCVNDQSASIESFTSRGNQNGHLRFTHRADDLIASFLHCLKMQIGYNIGSQPPISS